MTLADPTPNYTKSQAIKDAVKSTWALMLGMGLLMVGHGLQSSLLGIRAGLEGFSVTATGITMAFYFLGFMIGSVWSVSAVRQVGHIRTFAALTSLASIAILLHSMYIDPIIWSVMRFLTGVCFAGLFVVAESWLNDRSDNTIRGEVMSLYMLSTFIGLSLGQVVINMADPGDFDLFIIVSVVISVAVVPMLLNTGPAPDVPGVINVKLSRLYQVSPTGVTTMLFAGFVNAAILGMAAVYATEIGFSVAEVSLFMLMLLAGGIIFQVPIGKLSDIYNRRFVLIITTFVAAGLAYLCIVFQASDRWLFMGVLFVFGGVMSTLYPLGIAYTNDHLEQTELVGASSGLVMFYAAGSILGPIAAGYAMDFAGPNAYFGVMVIALVVSGCFGAVRMIINPEYPDEEAIGEFMPVPMQVTTGTLTEVEEYYSEGVEANAEAPPTTPDPASDHRTP